VRWEGLTAPASNLRCRPARVDAGGPYRHEHNRRFAIAPEEANSAWRPCPSGLTADEVCALQYGRVALNNNTVRVGKRVIDIPKRAGCRRLEPRTKFGWLKRKRQMAERKANRDGVTESLTS
jgi:hypothetical protein